ncbi:site-specific DNA-methyltransferase [Sphingobium agri]|uniref:site-specific DNA-methyltransferase (adenine-specific) n=1 Tax=Sphingobium agri TaxID=2933566 RepID=A0ABT0DUP2_9SPHN|nr:DNA methyltransferase [Sphingobium agri]MCK0530833.1 ParB N-terminal domain-containing protein [Sphingobium agri]
MPAKSKSRKSIPLNNFGSIRLAIEYVSPHSIALSRRELRKHPQSQIRELASGIGRIGFTVPLIVDERLSLVCGHARLAAAKLLELDEVPVIRLDHLTPEQLRLFAMFDNRVAEHGEWDEGALALEFAELALEDVTLDISDSGFAVAEIDAIVGRSRTAELSDLDSTQAPDETKPAITHFGDLWHCGRHRLLCGDSTHPEAIARLTQGAKIRQVVTDPPFDLPTAAFSSSKKFGNFLMGAGEMGPTAFTDFLARFIQAAQPVLMDGAFIYAFMDHKHIAQLIAAGEQAGVSYVQLLVWVKGQAGMGSFYRSGHELVGVFRHGHSAGLNNIMLGAHGRNRSNVLSYPGVRGKGGGGATALAMHPTVKNVAMIADLLLDASAPGEAILDSFGGSGTTLIAAEKVDRTAYLCELSPGFVDVAVERFEALGDEKAILEATGQTFAEVREERSSIAGGAA